VQLGHLVCHRTRHPCLFRGTRRGLPAAALGIDQGLDEAGAIGIGPEGEGAHHVWPRRASQRFSQHDLQLGLGPGLHRLVAKGLGELPTLPAELAIGLGVEGPSVEHGVDQPADQLALRVQRRHRLGMGRLQPREQRGQRVRVACLQRRQRARSLGLQMLHGG
jgi:hypothetical protein